MKNALGQKNRLLKKLRSRRGFSLSELLVTLILVGLITSAVAGGVSMVARSYSKVVDRADAEQLLATTLNKMQDELCFARVDLETPKSGDDWSFISGISGLRIRFLPGDASTGAKMEYLQGTGVISTYQFTDQKLITGNRMYVTLTCKPEFDNNNKFTGRFLIVNPRVISLKANKDQILAQLPVPVGEEKAVYTVAAINYRKPVSST